MMGDACASWAALHGLGQPAPASSSSAVARKSQGFVDPVTHLGRPAGSWAAEVYWSETDAVSRECKASVSTWTELGPSHMACGWLLGSEFGEDADDVLCELQRRVAEMPRWWQEMAERRTHSVGTVACDSPALFLGPGNFLHFVGLVVPLRSFINIGANDGVFQNDPLKRLSGPTHRDVVDWGFAVEADAPLCESYRRNFPRVPVFCGALRPDNLEHEFAAELRRAAAPHDPKDVAVLKVDIDTYDCDLVLALLRMGLRPKLIVMEVNVNIPPPFRFNWEYRRSLASVHLHTNLSRWNWMFPVFGCSLSAQVAMLRPFGFALVYFWESDAVFLHESELPRVRMQAVDGPLDEYDCFQKAFLSLNGVGLRTMRRWLHEISAIAAYQEIAGFLETTYRRHVLERMPASFRHVPYTLTA